MEQMKKAQTLFPVQTRVRMGNKEWLIGEAPQHVQEREPSKLITLQGLTGERQSQPEKRAVMSKHLAGRWHREPIGRSRLSDALLTEPWVTVPAWLRVALLRVQATSVRVVRRTRPSLSSLRVILKLGMTVGLAWGCVSLYFIHQMDSVNHSHSQSASVAVPAASSIGVEMPGVRVYVAQIAKMSSRADAERASGQLHKRGLTSEVVPNGSDWLVVGGFADQSWDLQAIQKALNTRRVTSHVVLLNEDAGLVPVSTTASRSAAAETQAWLSNEVSALTTLTAWAADGGRSSDAQTALENANAAYPGDAIVASTGLSLPLTQLDEAVAAASRDLHHGNRSAATSDLATAYSVLFAVGRAEQ